MKHRRGLFLLSFFNASVKDMSQFVSLFTPGFLQDSAHLNEIEKHIRAFSSSSFFHSGGKWRGHIPLALPSVALLRLAETSSTKHGFLSPFSFFSHRLLASTTSLHLPPFPSPSETVCGFTIEVDRLSFPPSLGQRTNMRSFFSPQVGKAR